MFIIALLKKFISQFISLITNNLINKNLTETDKLLKSK